METVIKNLSGSRVELGVIAPAALIAKQFDKAAAKLSQNLKMPGFRPGKIPVTVLEQRLGRAAIWEEAIELALPEIYVQTLTEKKIDAVGRPKITLKKAAPDNDVEFVAETDVLPEFELPDISKLRVEKKKVEVIDKEVDEAVEELRQRSAKSKRVNRAAQKKDRVEVDFKAMRDKVVIEGGESKNHPLVIGEGRMVPGFEDQLIGLKENEAKNFTVRFPKDYHVKDLANRDIDFEVTMKSVHEVELPELSDDWAKTMPEVKDVPDLKKRVRENIQLQKADREKQRFELAIIDAIQKEIEKDKTLDLPESLIHAESHKLMHDFEEQLAMQGMNLARYLEMIKKSKEEFEKSQEPAARRRVIIGLILRKVAAAQKLKVEDKEIDNQIAKIKAGLKNADEQKYLESDEYRDYLAGMLENRKVFEWLTQAISKF